MPKPCVMCGATPRYLLEVLVTVDVFLVMGVLQLVGLDVLPEGLDDAGAGLSVNAEQARQARVQLKLGGLRRRRTETRRNRITTRLEKPASHARADSPIAAPSAPAADVGLLTRASDTAFARAAAYRRGDGSQVVAGLAQTEPRQRPRFHCLPRPTPSSPGSPASAAECSAR